MTMASQRAFAASIALAAASALGGTAAQAAGARVEAFSVGALPMVNARDASVHHVDALLRLEQQLSANLPSDPSRAHAVVAQRIAMLGPRLEHAVREGSAGLARCAQLGIQRVPAIVFDGRWVVYGVTDVDAARRIFSARTLGNRRSP
jgi:integrating conjugative element protein (TIGR03757 family)